MTLVGVMDADYDQLAQEVERLRSENAVLASDKRRRSARSPGHGRRRSRGVNPATSTEVTRAEPFPPPSRSPNGMVPTFVVIVVAQQCVPLSGGSHAANAFVLCSTGVPLVRSMIVQRRPLRSCFKPPPVGKSTLVRRRLPLIRAVSGIRTMLSPHTDADWTHNSHGNDGRFRGDS